MKYQICLKFKNDVTVADEDVVTFHFHGTLEAITGKVIGWHVAQDDTHYKTNEYIEVDTSEQYKASSTRIPIDKIYRVINRTTNTDTQNKTEESETAKQMVWLEGVPNVNSD